MTSSTPRPKKKPGAKKGTPNPSARGGRPAGKENRRKYASKECSLCGETKSLDQFYKRKVPQRRALRAIDPRRSSARCKECSRAKPATEVDPRFTPDRVPPDRKAATKEEKRKTAAAYKRSVRRAVRIKALQYLSDHGCQKCGERDPRVLEFDHLNPSEKSDKVSRLLAHGFGWASPRLRAEIRKCRVLCVRCHRLHTATQMEYYKHNDVAEALQEIFNKHGIKK